jgi:hypothetical protein
MVAPERLVVRVKRNPMPLPPAATRFRDPRGGTTGASGVRETPSPTATLAAATLPSESVSRTTSVTSGLVPAV